MFVGRKAKTVADFEAIRQIRNAGREWMADSREVSPEQQAAYRESITYPVWVYEVGSFIVGYGLVKSGDDRCAYVSLAVDPMYRGLGLGRQIYRHLRSHWQADPEIWAVIRLDNTASIMAALSAGFSITACIHSRDTIVLKAEVLR